MTGVWMAYVTAAPERLTHAGTGIEQAYQEEWRTFRFGFFFPF